MVVEPCNALVEVLDSDLLEDPCGLPQKINDLVGGDGAALEIPALCSGVIHHGL